MKPKETNRRSFLKGMATLMASPLVSKLDVFESKNILEIDGVERMRITTNGHVVLGITSPNTNLFINR